MTVTTYDGDTTMGSSVTECRVYVPDTVRPTAALTVTSVNDNAVLEQWGVFVKGMTRLRWQVTAQGAYGASIDGCSVSCGGVGGQRSERCVCRGSVGERRGDGCGRGEGQPGAQCLCGGGVGDDI